MCCKGAGCDLSLPALNASGAMSSGVAALSHQAAFQATLNGFQASCSAAQFSWGVASLAATSPTSTRTLRWPFSGPQRPKNRASQRHRSGPPPFFWQLTSFP